jgi:hypothetical protein
MIGAISFSDIFLFFRHELAMQALQQHPDQSEQPDITTTIPDDQSTVPQPAQTQVISNSETDSIVTGLEVQITQSHHHGQPQQVIQDQPDLTLTQPDVVLQSQDLTTQAVISDTLSQNSLEQQLQQTLNQQVHTLLVSATDHVIGRYIHY